MFASEINEEMKVAAVYAIANLIQPQELTHDYVIPNAFDNRVVESVANAAIQSSVSGVARQKTEIEV